MAKKKAKKRYYVVERGRGAPCICSSLQEAQLRTKGFPSAVLKKYTTLSAAQRRIHALTAPKIRCAICDKPTTQSGGYCRGCTMKINKMNEELLLAKKIKYPFSKGLIAAMVATLPETEDVFNYIKRDPRVAFSFSKQSRTRERPQKRYLLDEQLRGDSFQHNTPKYIQQYFLDNDDKTLVDIQGNPENPRVTFWCYRCDEQFTAPFDVLQKSASHKCTASLSSGEYAVKKFLDEHNIPYLTQYDTLTCVNPQTGYVLPYDFEIPSKKLIIEVQGDQHTCFTHFFHTEEDAFLYQQYKDKVKKERAIKAGYTFIELFYKEIQDKSYKQILEQALGLT